jgi:hypothetical protein
MFARKQLFAICKLTKASTVYLAPYEQLQQWMDIIALSIDLSTLLNAERP